MNQNQHETPVFLKEYKSQYHKNKTFKATDRVHWFEYSSDGIVVNGGYGTLLEIKKQDLPNYSVIMFSVLCDDGNIRDIVSNDVEPMDEWE